MKSKHIHIQKLAHIHTLNTLITHARAHQNTHIRTTHMIQCYFKGGSYLQLHVYTYVVWMVKFDPEFNVLFEGPCIHQTSFRLEVILRPRHRI